MAQLRNNEAWTVTLNTLRRQVAKLTLTAFFLLV